MALGRTSLGASNGGLPNELLIHVACSSVSLHETSPHHGSPPTLHWIQRSQQRITLSKTLPFHNGVFFSHFRCSGYLPSEVG